MQWFNTLVRYLSTGVLRSGFVILMLMTLMIHASPSLVWANAVPGDEYWDDRFGTPGLYNTQVDAAARAPNGDLYVGGYFPDGLPGVPAHHIARWDGRRWHALGDGISGGGERVRAIAINGTTVYVGGDFTRAGDVAANRLAQWDGAAWAAIGSGVGPTVDNEFWSREGVIYALALGPDGSLYVGGEFTHIDGVAANNIARWDGVQWHALAEGLGYRESDGSLTAANSYVYALAVAPSGTLYAGGTFTGAGTTDALGVARWNGAIWSALGGGVSNSASVDPGEVRAIAINGNLVYVGGKFDRAGGTAAANIAAWNGTSWSALGSGVTTPHPFDPVVLTLLVDGANLYVGGMFTHAGGQSSVGIARWDGRNWSAPNPALSDLNKLSVSALVPAAGGGFFAAGYFQDAGDRLVFNIARWTGARWANLGEGVSAFSTDPDQIMAMARDTDGRIYAGGIIRQAGGLTVQHLAMWDGAQWHDIGMVEGGGSTMVRALLVVGNDLYVGGDFTRIGGIDANRIAKWNRITRTWSALGNGMNGPVHALAWGDGVLYAGGIFNLAGTVEAQDVAAWNGNGWSALGGNYRIYEIMSNGKEAPTYVNALAYTHGQLIIGGYFQTIHELGTDATIPANYTVVRNIVIYEPATTTWYLLGGLANPGVSTGGNTGFGIEVFALTVIGNQLFVGGTFTTAGAVNARNLARYDILADSWGAPGDVDGPVRALAGFGGSLYVGGPFTSAGSAAVHSLARYDADAGQWGTLGSGLRRYDDHPANVLSVLPTPEGLYVGGQFTFAGEQPALGFARWGGPMPESGEPDRPYKIMLPLIRR